MRLFYIFRIINRSHEMDDASPSLKCFNDFPTFLYLPVLALEKGLGLFIFL